MRILAVDLGAVRTGIAVSDESRLLASPVGTITQRNKDVLLEEIAALVEQYKACEIVVGLPRNMDGTKGESAQIAELFAEKLKERTGVLCATTDEQPPLPWGFEPPPMDRGKSGKMW